jgi:hypothetical protein
MGVQGIGETVSKDMTLEGKKPERKIKGLKTHGLLPQ